MLLRCTKAFTSTSAAHLEAFTNTLPLELKLQETLMMEWTRLLRSEDNFPPKQLVIALQSNREFLEKYPTTFCSKAILIQQDLKINISNLEPLPKDSYTRILHFKRPIIHPKPNINKPKRDWTEQDNSIAKKHTKDQVAKLTDAHIAFTDGSALGNPGPCGASAIIINKEIEPTTLRRPIAVRGSSYQGELVGILLALECFQTMMAKKAIHIFCDCQSAIDSLTTSKTQATYQQIIDGIQKLIRTHTLNKAPVHLHWTPGHIELEENELADKEAKQAATEAKALPHTTTQLTIKDAKNVVRTALIERWQRQWNRTQQQSLMHTCYPVRSTARYKTHTSIQAESQMLRLLSGHNCLKMHMHKIKLAQTPNCPCGLAIQNPEHILLTCTKFTKQRLKLHLDIEQIYHKCDVPTHQRISSLQNILGPNHTRPVNTAILKATGSFLDSINLKI